MKKIFFVCLLALMLTGCKRQVNCSYENEEFNYDMKEEIILDIDKDDFVNSVETTITMEFETEKEAQENYKVFKQVVEESTLTLNKNKIIQKSFTKYSDKSKISEIKEQLESSGYECN